MKKSTFAKLGIPFPLHEAPVSPSDDSDYFGVSTCSICGAAEAHCFELGDVILSCPTCGTKNGVDVHAKHTIHCRNCQAPTELPTSIAAKKQPKACYACLRAGHAAITKDTEFGMVSFDQALAGVTNGVPGLQQDQFESVFVDADEEWIGVRLPESMMLELLRTPTYGSWQGECWLFCCRQPMTFVGEWRQEEFAQRSVNGNGEELYYKVLADAPPDSWGGLGEGLCAYVFECKQCGKFRAHYDSD